MVFRNYLLRFSILLTITLCNIVYSSALPPSFIDLLNAENRRVINIAPEDQPVFHEFFNALNFSEGEYAKERAKGAFTRIPSSSRSDFIAIVAAFPIGARSPKADFVLILSMFPSDYYPQIRELILQEGNENIEPLILQYGQELIKQGHITAER